MPGINHSFRLHGAYSFQDLDCSTMLNLVNYPCFFPQVPTTIGREKQCNPFLRTSSPEIRKMLSIPDHFDDARVLEVVRRAKDNFWLTTKTVPIKTMIQLSRWRQKWTKNPHKTRAEGTQGGNVYSLMPLKLCGWKLPRIVCSLHSAC